MGRNPKVCSSCYHNCRLFHRPHGTTTTLHTSFFKLMLHQNDFKLLYLPPKLKRTMSVLVGNENIHLEDSTGRWVVTVANVDGSLAFKEGWDVFSLDHKLQIGDFLVFCCIDKLNFSVKIYDETVCERTDFSKRRIRKKRDRNCEFVRQDPNASLVNFQTHVPMQSQHMEVDLGEAQNNLENVEDACYITNHAYQNDAAFFNKDPMFEEVLSTGDTSYVSKLKLHGKNNCPMEQKSSAMILVQKNNKHKSITSHGELQECQFTASLGSDRGPISKGRDAWHEFELETSGRKNSLGDSDKNAYEKTCSLKHAENKKDKSFLSKKEIQKCQFDEGLGTSIYFNLQNRGDTEEWFNEMRHLSDSGIHIGERKKVPANMTSKRRRFKDKLHATELPKVTKGKFNQNNEGHCETVATISSEKTKPRFNKMSNRLDDRILRGERKEVPVKMTPKLCNVEDKINVTGLTEVIKRELNEEETDATITCVMVTDNNYLELSKCLPLSRAGLGSKRMVVYLKDPLARVWPVLCIEKTLLIDGWLDFQRENNIKPSDVCVFKVEDKYERIVSVRIDHK